MARGSQQANTAATSAQNLSDTSAGSAGALYSTLAPELMAQASHPAGFDPTTLAKMTTEATETGGGTQAAAQGRGALQAARTRNAGGSDAATAESARTAGEQVSRGVLGTQLANEQAKMGQQSHAENELGNLYTTNLGSAGSALGEVASNVNANTNEENASWDWTKYLLDPLLSAAGSSSGTIGKAFGVGGK